MEHHYRTNLKEENVLWKLLINGNERRHTFDTPWCMSGTPLNIKRIPEDIEIYLHCIELASGKVQVQICRFKYNYYANNMINSMFQKGD